MYRQVSFLVVTQAFQVPVLGTRSFNTLLYIKITRTSFGIVGSITNTNCQVINFQVLSLQPSQHGTTQFNSKYKFSTVLLT